MQPEQLDRIEQAVDHSAAEVVASGAGVEDPGIERRLEQLTRAAVETVPAADAVALTMRSPDGGLDTYAATSPDLVDLDRLQVVLNEGPCVDALAGGTSALVDVADLAGAGERWPRFAATAAEQGLTSLLLYALTPDGAIPAAVTFWSRSPAGFDELSRSLAGTFATQVSIAVYGARRTAGMGDAVPLHDVLGQATGIVMERHRTDDGTAFEILLGASRATELLVVDVARRLVVDAGRSVAP